MLSEDEEQEHFRQADTCMRGLKCGFIKTSGRWNWSNSSAFSLPSSSELWCMQAIKIPELEFARVTNIWDSDAADDADFRLLCSLVKFRSPQHTTLSAVGVAVIIAFTAFVTLLSCVGYLIPYVSKRLE